MCQTKGLSQFMKVMKEKTPGYKIGKAVGNNERLYFKMEKNVEWSSIDTRTTALLNIH